ncbi:MAG: peptidylprolyl isomerase [Treponema sp.]|jgi:FKBP-type peptidyl-prolyl cis-trans isomerase SlyD|nr:peptidylprolyl isomerase [Treponema sp.]
MNVTKNRVVSIDYTLMDDRDNLIDTTSGAEPLDYLHGFENIIPGLEKALEGKSRGDHFSVNIPAAEAYGERDETLIAEIPLENFRGIDEVKPGMQFHTHDSNGIRLITVTRVADNTVTVDGNHPLAGLNLAFDVTVAGVREASEEELMHGHIHGHDHGGCGCGDGDCGGRDAEGCCGGCGR